MRSGTVARVGPDKVYIRLAGGRTVTVKRNDDEAWERNPTRPPHVIFIPDFDCGRDIVGLKVEVDTDWFMHGVYVGVKSRNTGEEGGRGWVGLLALGGRLLNHQW